MRMRFVANAMLVLGISLVLSACTSAPRAPSDQQPSSIADFDTHRAMSDSALEIKSLMGHKLRTFAAQASPKAVTARALVDRDLLKEGPIHPDGYVDLLKRAQAFIQAQLRAPTSNLASCRSPYSITLRIGERVQSARGCRTDPAASSFGKLARDGEFLLHSAIR